jgi:uncharacterized protein HemY
MTRILILVGIVLILVGLLWPVFQKLGLGHLPGDIIMKRKNFTIYFPITTCIILSIIISIIIYFIRK